MVRSVSHRITMERGRIAKVCMAALAKICSEELCFLLHIAHGGSTAQYLLKTYYTLCCNRGDSTLCKLNVVEPILNLIRVQCNISLI